MAQNVVDTSNLPRVTGARVAVLTSKWYDDVVCSLRDRCVEVLNNNGVTDVTSHTLPGCLEFPYAANELIRDDPEIDAIVCLGVVLKGDTMHFEMIVDEVVRGLGEVSRQGRVPIINEILPVTELAQARMRAADDELNKGIEAAVAAIEIIAWRQGLKN
ncbi:MAG: 6,7-dimethyl-8-ribityllumazine synthase [Pseudomonadota bacterium]|uniref:6,7-dimethyl-8-ribityllumazine synthase n=1 Tax=marine metagenome TaxID=408172 RepID=A0A381NTB7_9ZZZZ|nr:6,7-dimethyl-8-ribityllumazine synthase [Gammaproteobacteria bacterium]MEC8833858.1 6,7-dimethyl-8-ribityllumazine synthase [Pseudomonadota bacterium]MEC8867430.1 6,7-dimethyl-8-ribityllumazine synthase [Pseudomonadota bacterium]MEC9286375.1 6,7-dimethyl-8-ribityllumazine synthase [Pseudomonadota bacterium]MEE3182401.1 6,7-dimethyl-8-ribityllumazine synthase [Pseudomonadota bacterium]